MSEDVLANLIGPFSSATFSPAHVEGMPFQVTLTGVITRLGWYRPQTGAAVGPDALTLWSTDFGGNMLAKITSPGDNGTVGWQWSDLDIPVQVYPGRVYSVAMHLVANNMWARLGSSPAQPTPTAHTIQAPSRRVFNSSGGIDSYPGSADNQFINCVDATWDTLSVNFPGDPVTLAGVDNLLTAWFSENDNTHQTDVPWTTKVAAGNAETASVAASTAAGGAQTAAEGNASAISNVSTQLDGVSGNVGTLLGRLSADLATKLNDTSDALAGLLNDAASVLGGGWEAFVTQFTRASGGSGFGLPDAMAGWTLVDETDWVEELAWAVPSDRYVLTFTETPPRTPGTSVAGVDWHPRLAWWCELNTGLGSERHYIDFADCLLQSPTGRMFGVLLNGGTNTAGHIQAWTKD